MAEEEEKLVPESEENGKGEEVKEESIANAKEEKKEDTNKTVISTPIPNQITSISPQNASTATDPVVQPLLTGRRYKNLFFPLLHALIS